MKLLTMFLMVPCALAQENVRTLDGPGAQTKYLTPGGTDTWKFSVDEGETLRLHVSTREFDPVLVLVDPGGTVLYEIDDEGSQSRLMHRVQQSGEHQILVRGFEHKGGGNYHLAVEEFRTTPIRTGVEESVRLDREGRAYLRLEGQKDMVLVPHISGRNHSHQWYDASGADMGEWMHTARVEEAGEHVLTLHGERHAAVRVRVDLAARRSLADGSQLTAPLMPGDCVIFEFDRAHLDFRSFEVEHEGELAARLFLPASGDSKRLDDKGFDWRSLPAVSKGAVRRFTNVFGRERRYELQVRSLSGRPQKTVVSCEDPRLPLIYGEESIDALPIGGARFHRFEALAGQLIRLAASSSEFDTVLRVFDAEGSELYSNDDAGHGLDSGLAFLAWKPGTYVAMVSSRGDGGGGTYNLRLEEEAIEEIEIGPTLRVRGSGRQYRSFQGKAGQTLLVSARATRGNPRVGVLDSTGAVLGQDDDSGLDRDSLLPLRLERDGLHTLWIDGEVDCELRLIEL